MFPKDGDTRETLLRNSSAAMLKAKSAGGSTFHFYAPAMNARSLERLETENALRRAIDQDQLVVYYQPQLNLHTGEIVGAEALVRWRHPEKGLIAPGAFIPLAEEIGFIVPLGEWVLRTACAQNKAWQDAGLTPITMSVNLSARQFLAQDVVGLASSILAQTGLLPGYLELELTESAIMSDADAFISATRELKNLSVTLSIDDFGTGYSSLSYLRRFAIDRLKIDQSFVRDVTHDPTAPPSPWPSSRSRTRSGSPSSPKASRPRDSSTSCAATAATKCRASISARRCRPPTSSGFCATTRSSPSPPPPHLSARCCWSTTNPTSSLH